VFSRFTVISAVAVADAASVAVTRYVPCAVLPAKSSLENVVAALEAALSVNVSPLTNVHA
jgi:branched-subunit amino acid transport protein AzlD